MYDKIDNAMKKVYKDFKNALVEVGEFLVWIFTGGAVCDIKAADWIHCFKKMFSWQGFETVHKDMSDASDFQKSELQFQAVCAATWLLLEYIFLFNPLTYLVPIIGMLTEKCRVLGDMNPCIDLSFFVSLGVNWGKGAFQNSASVSAGMAWGITAYAEKYCYCYMAVCYGWSFVLPCKPLNVAVSVSVSMNCVFNGSPVLGGYCNCWSISGAIQDLDGWPDRELSGNFFYTNYWFKFNAFSTTVHSETESQSLVGAPASYLDVGSSTSKIWVAICMMSFVAESCQYYQTGEQVDMDKQWKQYRNNGLTHGHDGKRGAFVGYS